MDDSLITGLRVVDNILPVGRGQRQLILGDRYTGKTSCFVSAMIYASLLNLLGSIDGFGSKRLFGLYVGLNQSLNKLSKLVSAMWHINYYSFIFTSHSTSCSLLTFLLPLLGVSIAERIRDIGFDSVICFDDLSKHSRSYRQINLLQQKLPSRDAFPTDVFNIHSSLLERISYSNVIIDLNYHRKRATITSFPCIETINSDISEYIATNVISITDGQFYMNKNLFNLSARPSIDSSLSVSRVGGKAQCKLIKLISAGIKNELTTLRNNYNNASNNASSIEYDRLIALNHIFYQDHLSISEIETSLIVLFVYKHGILFNELFKIHCVITLLAFDYIYFYYILSMMKADYSLSLFCLLKTFLFRLVDSL